MGCLKRYDSVQDILKEFFELRLHYYKLRKDWLQGSLGAEAAKLSNQARFVLEKIEGKISIGERRPKRRFEPVPISSNQVFLCRKQVQTGADPHAGAEGLRIGSCGCVVQSPGKGTAALAVEPAPGRLGKQLLMNVGLSDRLRKKTPPMVTRATVPWTRDPRRVQTSTTSSTCLCGA